MSTSLLEPPRLVAATSALIGRQRAGLARAVRDRVAGDRFEEAHAEIWYSPGPRWFSESDAIWEVHADTAMFIGGIRALLLQALHPVAMLGVSEHSGYRTDPWGRLQRTSHFLATTTYGRIEDAERSIRIVRAIHKRVTGTTADGTPYAASDPHLLRWIHVAEVDSFLTSHQTFGAKKLSEARSDEYVRQAAVVARKLGVIDPPETVAAVAEELARYRPELAMTRPARETVDMLLKEPPLEGVSRVGYTVLAAAAVSTLPAWVRTTLSLPILPIADRLVARPLARSALATIRWALAGETPV